MPGQEPSPDDVQRSSVLFGRIVARLTDDERDHFGLELLDAARSGDQTKPVAAINEWFMSAVLREHPDYRSENKAYHDLRQSGDLFAGVDFEPNEG